MPSITHETVVELVRNQPALVPALLADLLGVEVPAYEQARVEPADLTELAPTEYRADAVVVLRSGGRPVLAVVVEAQLHRNPRKRRTWPAYVAALHDRWDCPTALLVICVDAAVAAWCARPIDFGPGWRGVPLVVGPDRVPIPDPADLATVGPEMAVLAALAHGNGPDYRAALDALVQALSHADAGRAASYAGYVLAALPEMARIYLEALMKTVDYRYQGEYAHSLVAKGRAEGKADDVLLVLEARGIEVRTELRQRISGCTDVEQLDVWLRRAVTAGSVDELFG